MNSDYGFTIDPYKIADEIIGDLPRPGWTLRAWFDTYRHPDWETGMMIVHDPVDRVALTFVGSREDARKAEIAIREALQ